jgi:DNA polymerase III alpha subunit
MMAVLVRLGGADRERFESATKFEQHEGQLFIKDAEGVVVAVFAAGRWDGVFQVESRGQQEMRKIAASETSAALNALAASIGRQRG